MVDYRELPLVTDPIAAMATGAPPVWDDVPDNIGFLWKRGDASGDRCGFAERSPCDAAAIHRLARHRQHDGAARRLGASLARTAGWSCMPRTSRRINLRNGMANGNFSIKPTDIRVLPGDVGGSFGMKSGVQPEYALVAWAARKLSRPVRWISDRTEGFLTDEQAREMRITARTGAGCSGKVHRAEVALGRQPGRLRLRPFRLAGRQYRRHRRRLSYPDDLRRGLRHPDQHRADRRLSRRRPAGSDLHDRAPDRRRRARTRHQPVRTAPPQPDPARGDAVQDRAHLHL